MIKRLLIVLAAGVAMSMEAAANETSVDWKAHWIWQAEDGPANAWVAFRKSLTLTAVPTTVIANLSADSKYWMWINGQLAVFEGSVARGPSPYKPWQRVREMWELPPEAKPSNTWYEEVDITGYLRPGENTIAVLVWYWGRETHKGTHIDSGKGGFIFQADVGDEQWVSDRSWKVRAHSAYALDSGDTGKNIVQYNVKYDARKALGDWTSPTYADAGWMPATEKGVPPTAPWYRLEKNYVPALVNHGLQFYTSHPASMFPFTSTGETISCTLPFNQQITPYLEVESEAGRQIEIETDNPHNKIRASYTTTNGKQVFESYSWMNGHQVKYTIPAGVKVLSLQYRWMSVGQMAGSFGCSDPFLERLWWMGRNTLFVCARDNFMDCPDRERACWIGDVADQAGYLFYCMDDAGRQLLKKAIRITMAYSHEGVYAALGPLRLRELPSQSLQFVEQAIWQHYLNTGDEDTLRDAYPYVRSYLRRWTMESSGLPRREQGSMDMWNWSDWGEKDTIDQDLIEHALYFMALRCAKTMAETLGETDDIAWYDDRVQRMRKAFDGAYWSGEFYSSDPRTFQDDRGNCLTILSGLAGKENYEAIVNNVLIPNEYCSPHFEWMVEEALCLAGHHEAALRRMKKRYQGQVHRAGMSTLYEMFPNGGTYNHAWNAPNTILSKHIAGIAPTRPGWSAYQVLPTMLHLTSLNEVVPSVKGDISVAIRHEEGTYGLELVSPAATVALVGIPKSIGQVREIRANGKTIWANGHFAGGVEGIVSAGEDERFIKFHVSPGTWRFAAQAR